jgi:flagellar biogenesis protein FliO
MMSSVLVVLLLAQGDPASPRETADSFATDADQVNQGVEANRPAAISARLRPEYRDDDASQRATGDHVLPVAGDRPALAKPPTLVEPSPVSERPSSIKLSPATRRRNPGQVGQTEPGSSTTADSLSAGRNVAWWVTTGLGLAVVLAAIFLGGRVARRLVPGAMVGESTGPVHLLHRTFLSPKHTVCLVKCGDRILVIGLTGDRMQTLSEIHDPQEIDYLRGQLMQIRPRSTTQAFKDAFSSRAQLAEASTPMTDADEIDRPEGRVAGEGSSRTFVDQLATLRDQISRWKARAGT